MPRPIDREIASRAVDTWFRRLLLAATPRRERSARLESDNREIARARRVTRKALIEAVVDAGLKDDICSDTTRGEELLTRRLRDRSRAVVPQIERLERAVAGDPVTERRYRPAIRGARGLLEAGSDAPARLVREICLVVSLSKRRPLPWARRR